MFSLFKKIDGWCVALWAGCLSIALYAIWISFPWLHQWAPQDSSALASWVQAVGVLVTLAVMLINAKNDNDKVNKELERIKRTELTAIRYYLMERRNFINGIDGFIIISNMLHDHYKKKKVDAKNQQSGVSAGELVVCAIDCFKSTNEMLRDIFADLDTINFNDRPDLHSNRYVLYVHEIILAFRSLKGMFEIYENQKERLNKISDDLWNVPEVQKAYYYSLFEDRHSEWTTYAEASVRYLTSIQSSWGKINSDLTMLRAEK